MAAQEICNIHGNAVSSSESDSEVSNQEWRRALRYALLDDWLYREVTVRNHWTFCGQQGCFYL